MANMGFVTVQFESDETLEQNPNLNDPNVVTITETGIYRCNGDGKVNVVAGGGTGGSGGSGGLSPTIYYTKKQIDAILKERDLSQYYTKTESNALLLQKLDKTGSFGNIMSDSDGCFKSSTQSTEFTMAISRQYVFKYVTDFFDASRSSAVYGKSTTVQPHSIACFIWKRTA